jgi:hypothetical protein
VPAKTYTEAEACNPTPLNPKGFNPAVVLPYGLSIAHVRKAMEGFSSFLGFINAQLCSKGIRQQHFKAGQRD